jgi:serine/threonine-protein kinase
MRQVTPDQWRRIEAVLDQALELPSDARRAFARQACADDPALLADVEELLAADEQATGVLDESADESIALLLDAENDTASRIGERIGPYRIIAEIARGGMGAVYLAERADGQFDQRVALKLVRRGMDSEEVHRRFMMERQILARLDHPNIARLLDGGRTADGQPWFAMEYVEGAPITDWCDRETLDLEARLALVEQVCDAVSYAHRNLVVHRDLKPSNILVTPDGTVKLLDFGIARVLQDEAPGEEPLTQVGWRVMTPEYAAPEQVRGDAITTATDVYSLGAVLYELLTGHRAHRFRRRNAHEVERVVCEEIPESPSTVVTRADTWDRGDGTTNPIDPDQVSAARNMSVARLRKGLAGDLDTIVLKALRKEPDRRYRSAEALLEDLRRRRAGLPVHARPDTLRYRTRKFIRRNRMGLGAGAVITTALVAGIVGTTWQARAAEREARRATVVKDFLIGLFEVSRPEISLGREISARELLERGSRRADTVLAGQPELRAELLAILASIHRSLGNLDLADSMFARAVAEWREITGDEAPPELAAALTGWALVQLERGELAAAESSLVQALAMQRRHYAEEDTIVLTTVSGLAAIARRRDEHARAESLSAYVLDATRRQLGEDHLETARAMSNYATLIGDLGQHERADTFYRRALAIRERRLPADHPDILLILDNIGSTARTLGRYDESEARFRDVLARRRRVQGEHHPDVAWTAAALATSLERQGQLAEAESLMTASLNMTRQVYPAKSPELARVLNNLAIINYRMERYDTAAALTRAAMELWREALGPNALHTITAMNNLGTIYRAAERFAEAEPLLRDALRLRLHVLDSTHELVGQARSNLGVLLHRTGRLGEGEALLRQALATQVAARGAEHPGVWDTKVSLGELLTARRRTAEAERLLREALHGRRGTLEEGHALIAAAERALAECLIVQRRYAEAEPLLLASARTLTADRYKRLEAQRTVRTLARLYREWGRPEKAREAERMAVAAP